MRDLSRKIGRKLITGTLERGLIVLETVENSVHPLNIQEIAAATGIQRLAVYRLLSTLEARGYVRRGEDKRYRAVSRRKRLLIGYCAPLTGNAFRADLAASIQAAAAHVGVDIMMLDNPKEDAAAALSNAEHLVEARADLAMFFQPVERVGHMLSDKFQSSGIKFVTIERAIPGGVYFGANNYVAGKLAGRALGRFAQRFWEGRFDRVVLVEGTPGSTNLHARLAGVLIGLREVAGPVDESRVSHLLGEASGEESRLVMRDYLATLAPGTRLLVSGFNDLSAVGAAQAVRESGWSTTVAIVGHNAAQEGRHEIRREASPFIASVAYFPERYGPKLLKLAQSMIAGEAVPPAVYMEHEVIDRDNIDLLYPATASAVRDA
ncbi:MAG: substrate-binding domain-containing protein [Bryobacterales bacterium]|nr:substrate-binding domain-containing protein [Bryobacterales bacterium]